MFGSPLGFPIGWGRLSLPPEVVLRRRRRVMSCVALLGRFPCAYGHDIKAAGALVRGGALRRSVKHRCVSRFE
jgi:hypothetical protein